MYQVNVGEKILYYPASEDAEIFDTNLNEEVGLAGEFTFKVPPTNPLYNDVTTGAIITIFKDKKEFWRGEVKEVKIDFAKVAEVYCIEDLTWLGDEYMTPTSITNETYTQRFRAAINAYNANRPVNRQFTVGYVSNVSSSALCNWETEYEWSILDSLRECIAKDSGYLRVRRVTTGATVTRYIDIVPLSGYGKATTQTIEYGYNLLDYLKDSDYGNLTNVLTPYGDVLEDQFVYGDYGKRLQGTTITNATSVAAYGRHAKAVVFDGVTTAAQLNTLAQAYLTRYCQPQLKMEVKAVDLSVIENVDDIGIGDSVRIIAKPFAVDQTLYLTQIQRDLQDAGKNQVTLSGSVPRRGGITNAINDTASLIKDLPSESSILQAAKRNALSMLLSETQGGYVVYEYDANNENIEAINICNRKTFAASTSRWRWSYNGLGFMTRPDTSSNWSALSVAITKDGQIVADAVTTGTMYADRIKGGTLTLGGASNANGRLEIKNASGSVIGSWDKDGINATTGTFGGSLNAATGSFAGSLNAATGSFAGDITAATGKVGGADIGTNSLSYTTNSIFSRDRIGCGYAGYGIVNLVGNQSSSRGRYGYIQLSNSGSYDDCRDGLRLYGNGVIIHYDGNGDEDWYVDLSTL